VPVAPSSASPPGAVNTRFGAAMPAIPLHKLGSSLDAFVPFTQAITEDLFWQWMAVDVIALWMPRIYNSLVRGRDPYNAAEDPKFNNSLNEAQQMGKLAVGTVKGLNWRYFSEEASREFLIGPGMLGMMSVMYGLYRTILNPAIRMPITVLTQLTDSFGQYAATASQSRSVEQQLPAFLTHMLSADADLQKAIKAPLQAWSQQWTHAMVTASRYRQQYHPGQRFLHAVQHWLDTRPFRAQRNALPTNALRPLVHADQQLKLAETALKQAVKHYNLSMKPDLHYTHTNQLPVRLQQRVDKGLQSMVQPMDMDKLFALLNQWRNVPMATMHKLQAKPGAVAPAVSHVLAMLTRQKMLAVMVATLVTGLYLRGLTFIFQNNKDYPGNRGRHGQDLAQDVTKAAKP
jgi:hypothetical protein